MINLPRLKHTQCIFACVRKLAGVIALACMGSVAPHLLGVDQTPQTLSNEDAFAQIAKTIRPSVVAVGTYYFKDTPTVQYMGTGFVVGQGHTIVTNAHVVDSVKKRKRLKQMRVFFPDDHPVDGRRARVLAYDREHDVSLLKFDGPRAPAMVLELGREPAQGSSVGVMGYPIGLKLGLVPALHRGVISAVVPAVLPLPKGAKLTPQLAEAIRKPYNLYQLDMVVYPGNSGSPLFDAKNAKVYGIINKTLATKTREHLLTKPSGISYAVPSRWIRELMIRDASMSDADRNDKLKRYGLLGE